MKAETEKLDPIVFSPNLRARDELANYWMGQATLRIRREISWIWHERGISSPPQNGQLPPVADRASDSLDLSRHWAEKTDFLSNDIAARYLTERLRTSPPNSLPSVRGSFAWVVRELELDDIAAFTLALGLAVAFDASFGSVIASCLNDPARIYPNLMLVQRLWDRPEDVLALADPMHSIFAFGLLRRASQPRYGETLWEQPLVVPSLVARALLGTGDITAAGLHLADSDEEEDLTQVEKLIGHRLLAERPQRLRIVPLLGARQSAYRQTAVGIARLSKMPLWEYRGDPALLANEDYFGALVTLSWLSGRSLFIRHELFNGTERRRESNDGIPLVCVPITIFLSVSERRDVSHITPELMLPFVKIPSLSFECRLIAWKEGFGEDAENYEVIIREVARRFRYEKETIRDICRELKALPPPLKEDDFLAACRAELDLDIGELATYVEPRFANEQLILPNKQARQFNEQLVAMQTLTKVHYDWGTARTWNESGITLLFAGPPGTGKTMAAEIMAHRLKLPMYRIDLSQVVNKYIGETEKNLKRIFDAADISDIVLFFDEADSLFGKRMEANDARDRYANLEVSYLLERMERFKGLAILATNRKNDLDQAFLRRIRHVIDFPVPDEVQRALIWRQSIPESVAKESRIDVAFLARQFPLSGGNIRSIVFNACLQSAHACHDRKVLRMKDVLIAVKREYDKLNRSLNLEQILPHISDIEDLDWNDVTTTNSH